LKLKYDLNDTRQWGKCKVVGLTVSLPAKWEQFLKQLADDHRIDLKTVISELCEWAFSDPEGKEQFKVWLDEADSQEREAEDEARAAGEEAAEEEEREEESEKETQDRIE
jgi:Ran GTPase-activating protein (RanGAP) involved in mRNA processing and transport